MKQGDKEKHLTTIAHEIKAPLSAIVNLLSVIDKGYVEDVEKARELISRAKSKATTVIRMLDDILDYMLLQDKSLMKRDHLDIYEFQY